jgi:BlaI family penicillinase repressor
MRLSDAEWQLMNALWADHPATAREIADRLPAEIDWAYTTIKTMLARLEKKRAVSAAMRGNTSVYTPLVARDEARRSALRNLIDQAFGGGVQPLLAFLARDDKLSDRERRELARILADEERKEGEPS